MIFLRAAFRAATSGEKVCVRGKVYAVIIWFELYKLVGESQPRKKRAAFLGGGEQQIKDFNMPS